MLKAFRIETLKLLIIIILIIISMPNGLRAEVPTEELLTLSIDELLNVEITTVSRSPEKISDAPGTVLILTKNDILNRGYDNLAEIFNDLPGMDFVRVDGDISFKNYCRGYRNTFGSDFLLLLDGLPWSDLYYNDAEVIRAMPISNIEIIEIVYGPVSSIYGANAFNGVINVKTVKDQRKDGSFYNGRVTGGSKETATGDLNFFHKKGSTRFSVTARFENKDSFPETNNSYEWSKSKYIIDRDLWGGFVESPATGGTNSLVRHKALDMRAYFSNLELGVQYYNLTSGYGIQYAADKVLPNVIWSKTDYSLYARFVHQTDSFTSTSALRYNTSDIPNEAALAQGFNITEEYDGNMETFRVINFELWQALNSSVTFTQDFLHTVNKHFSFQTGMEYEKKNLQKAYEISAGPFMLPDSVDALTYPFPDAPTASLKYNNRIIANDFGGYLNLKLKVNNQNSFHSGIRFDHNTHYGDEITLRTGYIRKFDGLVAKILYGEAFQEPSPRVLYGAWNGLGSAPDLKPEKGRTFEVSLSYSYRQSAHNLSLYRIQNTDTILNLAEGGRNIGERNIYGVDYYLRIKPEINIFKAWELWGYYSYINAKGDEIYQESTNSYVEAEIGDIAPHKFSFGLDYKFRDRIRASLVGRYISERKTVATNPVESVPEFFLMDLNIRYNTSFVEGVALSLKVKNLFNELYFHPGIRTANAGDIPGYWDDQGVWHGSAGWLNSLLPQDGRTVFLSLEFNY